MINEIIQGDCLEIMKGMDSNSIDAIVTDPPYGLSFMGKKWDYDLPSIEIWSECLRVLKPGGTALIFGGSRTYHRLACRVEDASFELKDCIMWVYGSGFPKATDISKGIDKKKGCYTPGDVLPSSRKGCGNLGYQMKEKTGNNPRSEEAKKWDGWKSHALKPAYEPIIVCMKPNEGSYVDNALKWGTGGLNIDGCRVPTLDRLGGGGEKKDTFKGKEGWDRPWRHDDRLVEEHCRRVRNNVLKAESLGRYPANFIHDGSGEVVSLFPDTGKSKSGGMGGINPGMWQGKKQTLRGGHNDNGGSAARFFYCAKASPSERNYGLNDMPSVKKKLLQGSPLIEEGRDKTSSTCKNNHPTVKPLQLMRYLIKLIMPPGENAVVLDPFIGSGSTGVAAVQEGRNFIGIEKEPEYVAIAQRRLQRAIDDKASKLF